MTNRELYWGDPAEALARRYPRAYATWQAWAILAGASLVVVACVVGVIVGTAP